MVRSNKQIIGFIFLLGALFVPRFFVASPTLIANADTTTPSFPSCNGYSGTIQAKYDYGTHAIVGLPDNQVGSDTVYDLGNANYLQCYCPVKGANGIQTNWLSAANLDQATIDIHMNQGWFYIGKGTDWGLDDMAFLAKNTDFTCGGQGVTDTPTPTPTITEVPTVTPTPVFAVGGVSADNNPTPTPTSAPATTATPTPQPVAIMVPAKELAATGTFIPNLMSLLLSAGFMLSGFSAALYGKSKKA